MNDTATHLAVTLLGSVALLIWGVRQVRLGVTQAFGPDLRKLLAAASENRLRAFLAGGFVSGLLQSSTATALLLGSFAGRGLISLPIALAMMLGADSTRAAEWVASAWNSTATNPAARVSSAPNGRLPSARPLIRATTRTAPPGPTARNHEPAGTTRQSTENPVSIGRSVPPAPSQSPSPLRSP